MAAKEKEYRRLPGRAVRRNFGAVAQRCRLWLGRDHLLQVDTIFLVEEYKRFYFQDIQAVSIRRTSTGRTINLVLSILLGLVLVGAVWVILANPAEARGWIIFWLLVASPFLISLGVNIGRGPTCVCEFRTAVQIEEIPTLRRLRRAQRVLRGIRPMILEAQGGAEPLPVTAEPASQPAPAQPGAETGADAVGSEAAGPTTPPAS